MVFQAADHLFSIGAAAYTALTVRRLFDARQRLSNALIRSADNPIRDAGDAENHESKIRNDESRPRPDELRFRPDRQGFRPDRQGLRTDGAVHRPDRGRSGTIRRSEATRWRFGDHPAAWRPCRQLACCRRRTPLSVAHQSFRRGCRCARWRAGGVSAVQPARPGYLAAQARLRSQSALGGRRAHGRSGAPAAAGRRRDPRAVAACVSRRADRGAWCRAAGHRSVSH